MQLINGNCLEVLSTLPNDSIDCVIADPPYAITQARWDTGFSEEEWNTIMLELSRIIKPKGALVLFGYNPFSAFLINRFRKEYRYSWVWVKTTATNFLNAKKQPLRNTEDIIVFGFGKGQPNYYPQKRQGTPYDKRNKNPQSNIYRSQQPYVSTSNKRFPNTTLYYAKSNVERKYHPSSKPVALLKYLVETYTLPGETVLDWCMGSGSTGCASVELGRDFIGIELDKTYYDIATSRVHP